MSRNYGITTPEFILAHVAYGFARLAPRSFARTFRAVQGKSDPFSLRGSLFRIFSQADAELCEHYARKDTWGA